MSHQQTPYCQSCYNPMPSDQEGRNPHRRDCPNQSPEQMIAVIKTQIAEFSRHSHLWVEKYHKASRWQAKFHTLRLENNGLRRQLRKQSAPAPGPEPKMADLEPQWRNPERYPASLLTDGRRFLTADEKVLPADAEFYDDFATVPEWAPVSDGHTILTTLTYATRTPLPK